MQAGRYVYTNGWGRNTSLGVNNGDGKMIVVYGPVFDSVRRDAVDTKPRCMHPPQTSSDLDGDLETSSCWSSIAVRVDLQLRSPPHVPR